MISRVELVEKNNYLLRRLTAEWLTSAYLIKTKDEEIAEIWEGETRKVSKLTVTLQSLQEEFETL